MTKKIITIVIVALLVILGVLFFLPMKAVSITNTNFDEYIDLTSSLSNPEKIDFTKVKSASCDCKVFKDTMSSTFKVETKINKKFAKLDKLYLVYPLPGECWVSGDCIQGETVKIPITTATKEKHEITITSRLTKDKFAKAIKAFENPYPAVSGTIRVPVLSF